MITRRSFLKRLVGLGVGVLGVHQALKAPTTADNFVIDRSGEMQKRKGSSYFLSDDHHLDATRYLLISRHNYEYLKRHFFINSPELFGVKILVSEPTT